jgi:hypothetical protein
MIIMSVDAGPDHGVHVTQSASELVSSCVSKAQETAAKGTLLRLPYETLFEYLKVIFSIHEHC